MASNGHFEAPQLSIEAFGEPLPPEVNAHVRRKIKDIMARSSHLDQFPGMQPVSFSRDHLDRLLKHDYYVCEKSDGIRVLGIMMAKNTPIGPQSVFLITDRKYQFREICMPFPFQVESQLVKFHEGTIIDAELVLDVVPGGTLLRMLIFDIIAVNGMNVMDFSLMDRMNFILKSVIHPWKKFYDQNPQLLQNCPFTVEQKEMFKAYHLRHVFTEVIPKLKHDNDGLIFTPVYVPYTIGTCNDLLKWKPGELCTVDFQVHVVKNAAGRVMYQIHISRSGRHEFFDWMTPSDDVAIEWLRHSPDRRIIECTYDKEWPTWVPDETDPAAPFKERKGGWMFMRYRDDKTHANDISVYRKIMQSIDNAASKEELCALSDTIRSNWLIRAKQPPPLVASLPPLRPSN